MTPVPRIEPLARQAITEPIDPTESIEPWDSMERMEWRDDGCRLWFDGPPSAGMPYFGPHLCRGAQLRLRRDTA